MRNRNSEFLGISSRATAVVILGILLPRSLEKRKMIDKKKRENGQQIGSPSHFCFHLLTPLSAIGSGNNQIRFHWGYILKTPFRSHKPS